MLHVFAGVFRNCQILSFSKLVSEEKSFMESQLKTHLKKFYFCLWTKCSCWTQKGYFNFCIDIPVDELAFI